MALSFAAGQVLTANQLNLLCPQYVVKASDQLVTNSATLINDNDVVFTLQPNQIYKVELNAATQATVNSCHLRLAWTVTGTVAAVNSTRGRMVLGSPDSTTFAAVAPAPDNMPVQMRSFVLSTSNLNVITTINSDYFIREDLLITGGTGGGTLQLQFAQFTAVAAQSVKLMAGTFCICRCVA